MCSWIQLHTLRKWYGHIFTNCWLRKISVCAFLEIDECESAPCSNGGTCKNEVGEYHCICAPGYNYTHCQNGAIVLYLCFRHRLITLFSEIDECESSPCSNGGQCTDIIAGYHCTCPPGYNYTHCENGIFKCALMFYKIIFSMIM